MTDNETISQMSPGGPGLRSSERLSQRYPHVERLGAMSLPLTCALEVQYPCRRGVSQRYLRDTT